MEEDTMTVEEQQQNNGKKTGAKVAKTIGIIALCAAIGAGVYFGVEAHKDYKETKRAESLVAAYMDADSLVQLPEDVMINSTYDQSYCEGEKLAQELTEAGAQYCIIDGQYYTPNGDKIAILTFDITRTETVQAQVVEYNGNRIYMAPEGYTLNGSVCEKTISSTITKIVPSNETGDYSNVAVTNVTDYTLVNVEEVSTLSYEEMYSKTLICDVDDKAKADDNGYCEAELRLVPRKR